MKFGVQVEPQFGYDYDDIFSIAEYAVKNGFDTLWFSDHFMLDKDATDRVLLDPWLVMAAIVRENPTIRVGSLVFCNNYRPPALHAKMGATLDALSNGRFEFGIGAGWKEIEYNAYGYTFPKDIIRIEQLAEGIQIIKKIWTEEKPTFNGKHYTIRDIVSFPKTVQQPHPTIWVGTMYAKPKMLELTAKYGDGINVAWSFGPKQCEDIFKRLDELCKKFGRDEREMKKSVGCWTRLYESEEEMETAIVEGASSRNVSEEDYRKRVEGALWGTPDMIVKQLKEYTKLDVTHMILMFPHRKESEYIKKFGELIFPRI